MTRTGRTKGIVVRPHPSTPVNPALEEIKDRYSTVIVGAGIIGTSIAYYLSKMGLTDVLVVEREVPCSGSTGRCIGGVRQQFSDVLNIGIAMQSVANMKDIQEREGADIQFLQTGYLLLAYSEAEMEIFRKNVVLQRDLGLDVRILDRKGVAETAPGINTDGIVGATHCPQDGQANPFLLVNFYVNRARRAGVTIVKETEVTAVELSGGRVSGVVLDDRRTVKCDRLVNAAGPWMRDVAAMVGLDLPAFPERHESLVTEKVAPIFRPMIVDYTQEHGCYFQQKENGAIIGCFTPAEPLQGLDFGVSIEFIQEMSRRMLRLFPSLEHVSVVRHWSGHYTMTPDGKPIIGEAEKVPGFINAGAFCGHGLMQGPRVGELVAEGIVRGATTLDISALALERFEKGEVSSKELLK